MKGRLLIISSLLLLIFLLPSVVGDFFGRVDTNAVNATQNVTIGTGATTVTINGTTGNITTIGNITGNALRIGASTDHSITGESDDLVFTNYNNGESIIFKVNNTGTLFPMLELSTGGVPKLNLYGNGSTLDVDGMFKFSGPVAVSSVGVAMSFKPTVTAGTNFVALFVAPHVEDDTTVQAYRLQPTFDRNQKITMLNLVAPTHKVGFNDTFIGFSEVAPRQYFTFVGGDNSNADWTGFKWGNKATLGDGGTDNADYSEDMIDLTGGGERLAGNGGSIDQKGIKFTGFGTQTNLIEGTDSIYAVKSDGGIFEWEDAGTSLFNITTTTLIDQPHGEVYNITPNGYTQTISSLNTWYNITGLLNGEMKDISLTNGFNVTYSGRYKLDWSISFSGSGGSTHGITALINNVEHAPCRSYRKLGTAGDVGNAGGTCIMTLNANDLVTGAVNDISAPAQNINIWSVNANIIRIGDI